MTYDAHVFFETRTRPRRCEYPGSHANRKQPLFVVEPDPHNPLKLFYRVEMYDPVDGDTEIYYRNRMARFADHFTAIVQRTGKHNQNGDLFANFEIGPRALLKSRSVGLAGGIRPFSELRCGFEADGAKLETDANRLAQLLREALPHGVADPKAYRCRPGGPTAEQWRSAGVDPRIWRRQ